MSLSVLVVEDSSAMRAFVRGVLEDDDSAQVMEANSGFEAIRLLPRNSFDLIVVDINMPDINGLELLSFIRKSEAHAKTPVIVISTEASDKDRQRGLSLGANAFLKKPFTAEQLREVVTQIGVGS